NAADLLPSTEYAIFRLLLKHGTKNELFKVLNDSINYGVFPNYHASALILDYLLKEKDYPGAAKVASVVVQQEMFDNSLLNHLCLYSLFKFAELPIEQQIFDDVIQKRPQVDEDVNEDDIKTMKFPYLKNYYFDGHFDLIETDALVGKSLEWLFREIKAKSTNLDEDFGKNVEILVNLYNGKMDELEKVLGKTKKISKSVVELLKSRVGQLVEKLPAEGREENEDFKRLNGLL
uniref:Uncharacterized protein n=1 Tax=Panagrolaimus sp. JU765 TaxID=591449 RepID=A0AC34RK71_9BILA